MGGATSTSASGGAPGFLRNLEQDAKLHEGLGGIYDTFPLGDVSDGKKIISGCNYTYTFDEIYE